MTQAIQIIPRNRLDTAAWDVCIQTSPQRVVYGYSWYLDAVLPSPSWKWIGLVQLDNSGQYVAVMPIPLRRKGMASVYQKWVVHQPLFCQFLGVFSRDEFIDIQPFFDLLVSQFRYGSVYAVRSPSKLADSFGHYQIQFTHILDLVVGYSTLYQNYTRDRKQNLYRAKKANWTIIDSDNVKPLLTLFRDHHAPTVEGSVSDGAYTIFQNLFKELTKRGLVILRYAIQKGRIEAGALFVCEGNRIIYLFNAASLVGRKGNARSLLIDELIRKNAGQPMLFDFESPAKQSIRDFYQSFGAVAEPFYTLHWNQLNSVEKALLRIMRRFRRDVGYSNKTSR